ncbi:MAG: hypothetical protein A2V93_00430 [Ignavibacteria bacterium RBG_16_34_14]|nr:MAG: hypothetical protein A2V93_00430 [Ignavibacteria bacterium RBG_16_34_14]
MSHYKHFFLKYNKTVILSESQSGKILDVNEKVLSLFNKSIEDFTNLKRSDIFPQKAIKELNRQLKNSKDPASTDTFIINKDGVKVNVEVNSEIISEDNKEYLLDTISVKELKQTYPEITELYEAEKLVKESNVRYKTLFESANHAIFILKDDAIIELNSKALEMFAGTKEELLGKTPYDLSPEFQPDGNKSIEKAQEKIKNILKGEAQFFEWQHKKLDGSLFDAEVSLNSITFNNEIVILAVVRDITQRKHDESVLKQSETKFRSLVEESLVGVYIIQDGKFPYVNPRMAEIFGYTANEIISSKTVNDLTYEDDISIAQENIAKRLSGKIKTIRYTFRGKRKDNSLADIEVMGSSTIFNGKPAIIGTLLDVTEKNKADKEISKLSRAVEQSPASIIITNTDGNIEYVNPKFCELTGYSAEEVIGKNPRIFKYGDTPRIYYQKLWDTIKSGKEWRGEFLNRKKNGELFWEFASISPVKDNDGKIINFLAVKEDITERKHAEEELKIAKEKAEEMNLLKTVFLANMSHELRTPMVAMLGYSEILKNEIENQNLQEMASEIYESSLRLMNTLNLVLDLSRIEANKEVINLTEIDVVSVAAEELEFFRYLAVRKKLQLKTYLPDEPIITLLDERMFRQIIGSLINNAVKFTNEGSVSLSISKEYEGSDKQNVIIKISDTGIGIPKNSQSTIFDAFRQISEGFNRTFEGTGLGLTVAKKFIEMMQGTINVESEFGQGSTFKIKFPVIRRFENQPINMDQSQMKIEFHENKIEDGIPQLLLVEDDQSNAGVIKFFLETSFKVDMVLTGEEGIKKAGTKKYAAILMDIDLGTSMSGLEATRIIRRIPGYENTPIIAVTALAMRGDREKFLAEGCTHYISKPFKKEDLVNLIKEAVEQSKEKDNRFSG